MKNTPKETDNVLTEISENHIKNNIKSNLQNNMKMFAQYHI